MEKKEAANELTADFVDPMSKQPQFNQIEKVQKSNKRHLANRWKI